MDANTEAAIVSYVNKFEFDHQCDSIQEFFTAEVIMQWVQLLWPDYFEGNLNSLNTFVESSVIEGFNQILQTITRYYKSELQLSLNIKSLGIDTYDLVHDKDEAQLLKIIKLILFIIIKYNDETYINYMMELPEQESETMTFLCQDAMQMAENLKDYEPSPSSKHKSSFEESPDIHHRDSQIEQQYIDKINELNLQIESFDIEKRGMRLELSEEK